MQKRLPDITEASAGNRPSAYAELKRRLASMRAIGRGSAAQAASDDRAIYVIGACVALLATLCHLGYL